MIQRLLAACSALFAVALLLPTNANAIEVFQGEEEGTYFEFRGYAQPYFRWVDNPCFSGETGDDCDASQIPDGFGLTRARIGFGGGYDGYGEYYLELRTIPNVELLEARLMFPHSDWFEARVGRFKVPFSAQELTSESRLQLIDRANFIKLTPGRQLGMTLSIDSDLFRRGLPEDMLQLSVGIFNGESAKERAPVNNIDEDFLFSARGRISPFGAPPAAEGDLRTLGERDEFLISLGLSWSMERRGQQNGDYIQRNLSADLWTAWQGIFVYAELFRMDRDFRIPDGATSDEVDPDRYGFGWNVQGGFFIPVDYLEEHLELAGRVEYFDPETAVDEDRASELVPQVAGSGPARPSGATQAHTNYVAGINWYFRGHDLKLQANYTHRDEAEDFAGSVDNPDVSEDVDDDSFFLQLTYRF